MEEEKGAAAALRAGQHGGPLALPPWPRRRPGRAPREETEDEDGFSSFFFFYYFFNGADERGLGCPNTKQGEKANLDSDIEINGVNLFLLPWIGPTAAECP